MISEHQRRLYDLFADAYTAKGLNARAAARAVGIKYQKANALKAIAYVQVRIEENLRRAQAVARVKSDHVLAELSVLAYSNLNDFHRIDQEGNPILDMRDVTREQWGAVSEVQTYRDADGATRTRLKLYDKARALETLARHLKLLTDRVEVDGLDKLAEELKAARERVEAGKVAR